MNKLADILYTYNKNYQTFFQSMLSQSHVHNLILNTIFLSLVTFDNMVVFNTERLSAPQWTSEMKDYPLPIIHVCLFNIHKFYARKPQGTTRKT
jgi:hypothetical protein